MQHAPSTNGHALRDIAEAFVSQHLDAAMHVATALYCKDDRAAEHESQDVKHANQQEFLTLVLELQRLIEIIVRDPMTLLLPSFVATDETPAAVLKTEVIKHQKLLQSLPDTCQLRFRQLLEVHWDVLTQAAKTVTFSLPRVQHLHWKVAVEKDAGKRVWMRLQTSDGETRTMRVPMQQFHQLRHSVATVLQEMNEVETHPMMRLVAHMKPTTNWTVVPSFSNTTSRGP